MWVDVDWVDKAAKIRVNLVKIRCLSKNYRCLIISS